MQKEIEKNEKSLKKVHGWIKRVLNWEFENWEMILQVLYKREKILEKTRRKLVKLNKKHFTMWELPKNYLIS